MQGFAKKIYRKNDAPGYLVLIDLLKIVRLAQAVFTAFLKENKFESEIKISVKKGVKKKTCQTKK